MPVPTRIQRAAQKLAELVTFDEVETHMEFASRIDEMSRLLAQRKYKQVYEMVLSLIDSKKGSFSEFARDVGQLALQDMVSLLLERDQKEDAIQAMKQWLRRVPGDPVISCRLVDTLSPFEEAKFRVNPHRILHKVTRQHPTALHAYIFLARRIAFLPVPLAEESRLIEILTFIWGELPRMDWVMYPTRYNILSALAELFSATYRALVTPESQLRLREIIAQVEELLKPDEKPLLTEEQFNLLDMLNATIQQYATPKEEQELLRKIDIQTIRELLAGAELYEQIEEWLEKGRLHHAYRKLIPFDQWAQHPLHSTFHTQAISVLVSLIMQGPSRETRLNDLIRYADEWAALVPGDYQPHFYKAMTLIQNTHTAEAIAVAETTMSLSPKSIEPPILMVFRTDAKSPDPSVRLKILQMLQRAWRNLPDAQWIMPPSRNHVQTMLQILVATTVIGMGVFADMRQEAMEILDKALPLFGRNSIALQTARQALLSRDEAS